MNRARFGIKLLWSRLTGKRVPFQLNIHVTDACDLRCRYCYIDFKHAHDDLPIDSLRKLIREARACGAERISLEGGEPLVRKDIGGIVDAVIDLGMECNINTNGRLVPDRIDAIRRAQVLSVSLDGPREAHDSMRGKGSFDAAVRAIELARERGMRVHVLSVLGRHNRAHVDDMLDMAERMGFGWIPTSLFFMAGAPADRQRADGYMLPDEDYRRLMDELIKRKRAGRPVVWSESTLRYVRDWPTSFFESNLFGPGKEGFKPFDCQAGRRFFVLQTNGDLYPCDPLLGFKEAPNAVKLGFREAMARVSTHGCRACNSLVCGEYHQLFSLSPGVILNLLRSYGGGHAR